MADGSVLINVLADTSGAENALGKLGSILGTIGKVGVAAITAASAAIGGFAKQSMDAYANYEQLVGGVETLFGDAAATVLENADKAFQTAGMSANQYMEMVTGFSASLRQSLNGDTAEAARVADMAMIDMSDNANKMGTAMESIQNAYQGFAKQNYTMLDNLKLGYGGTKTEMERLLEDAEKLKAAQGELVDYDIDSFADVIEAIHVIQTDLGITGTTALEAADTISGSAGSLDAAWANLVARIGDENADLEVLVGDVIQSALAMEQNMVPRIENILTGIGNAIQTAAPIVIEQISSMIGEVLPPLLEAAVGLVDTLLGAMIAAIPAIAPVLVDVAFTIVEGIVSALPEILAAGVTLITTFVEGILSTLPSLMPLIIEVMLEIIDLITDPDTLTPLIQAGIEIMLALTEGIMDALPRLMERLPEIITNIVTVIFENLPTLIIACVAMIGQLGEAIAGAVVQLIADLPNIWAGIEQSLSESIPDMIAAGGSIIKRMSEGMAAQEALINQHIDTAIENWSSSIDSWAEKTKKDWNDTKEAMQPIFAAMGEEFNRTCAGMAEFSAVAWESITHTFETAGDWIRTFLETIWENVTSVFESIRENVEGAWNGLWEGVKGVLNNMLGGIEGWLNGAIGGINVLLGGVSAIAGKVGSLIGLGEIDLRLNEVTLPRLASGAVIPANREFLAVLGDQKQGTNVEAPLTTIEEAMRNVLLESGGGAGDIHLVIQLGTEKIVEKVIKDVNNLTRARGASVIRV